MGNPLIPTDLDERISDILDRELNNSDLSLRQLADKSGVKLTRLGDILRRGKAATVGELDSIADALGLIGWRVMQQAQAEDQLRATLPVVSLDERRSQADAYINETQAKLARVLRSDYAPAAKQHQPDPYANIGEENQGTGVQND